MATHHDLYEWLAGANEMLIAHDKQQSILLKWVQGTEQIHGSYLLSHSLTFRLNYIYIYIIFQIVTLLLNASDIIADVVNLDVVCVCVEHLMVLGSEQKGANYVVKTCTMQGHACRLFVMSAHRHILKKEEHKPRNNHTPF